MGLLRKFGGGLGKVLGLFGSLRKDNAKIADLERRISDIKSERDDLALKRHVRSEEKRRAAKKIDERLSRVQQEREQLERGRRSGGSTPKPRTELERYLSGEWVSVTSTNLDRIAWVQGLNGGTLKVIFKDKNEYAVWPISRKEAEDIYSAGSKGIWYWDHVRIRGTALGHKKNYDHVASHGDVQRRWTESPEKVVAHLAQMEDESHDFNLYGGSKTTVRGVIPSSIPFEFFLTEPPTPGKKKS